MPRAGAPRRRVLRSDVQVGQYTYRVLRPARPLRSATVTPGAPARLQAGRRDALLMLALAELVTGRTLVAFPLRDDRGFPFDLVVAEEALRFPAARWSDVRQRLGAGRPELRSPAPPAPPTGKRRDAQPEPARHALLIPLDIDRTDLARLRAGELDLAALQIRLA